ncbi:MAG: alpha/beta hydrolase [Pseudomonadota bacterium]
MKAWIAAFCSAFLLSGLAGTASAQLGEALQALMPRGHATYADVAYADRDPVRNLLDIYVPRHVENPPLVVQIHGGGFAFGDKSNPDGLDMFLRAGMAVASINYRLSDTTTWPGQLDDLSDAFAFLRNAGPDYSYDGSRIASLGASAGGHLSAIAGIVLSADDASRLRASVVLFPPVLFDKMDEDAASIGMVPVTGETSGASSPESMLIGAPVGENPDLAAAASPLTYLDALPDDTPLPAFLILHGADDRNIARGQSGRLFTALLNRPTITNLEYHLLPDSGHGSGAFNELEPMLMVIEFLRESLAE